MAVAADAGIATCQGFAFVRSAMTTVSTGTNRADVTDSDRQ